MWFFTFVAELESSRSTRLEPKVLSCFSANLVCIVGLSQVALLPICRGPLRTGEFEDGLFEIKK